VACHYAEVSAAEALAKAESAGTPAQ
jgi:hypothetical protein